MANLRVSSVTQANAGSDNAAFFDSNIPKRPCIRAGRWRKISGGKSCNTTSNKAWHDASASRESSETKFCAWRDKRLLSWVVNTTQGNVDKQNGSRYGPSGGFCPEKYATKNITIRGHFKFISCKKRGNKTELKRTILSSINQSTN